MDTYRKRETPNRGKSKSQEQSTEKFSYKRKTQITRKNWENPLTRGKLKLQENP